MRSDMRNILWEGKNNIRSTLLNSPSWTNSQITQKQNNGKICVYQFIMYVYTQGMHKKVGPRTDWVIKGYMPS